MSETPGHDQIVRRAPYLVRFPPHEPRESDPHYRLFQEFHRRTRADAECWVGKHSPEKKAECHGQLELHHTHLEFALQNAHDLTAIMADWPDVDREEEVDAWIESQDNLRWLCERHHRGDLGAHALDHAAWEAMVYSDRAIMGAPSGTS